MHAVERFTPHNPSSKALQTKMTGIVQSRGRKMSVQAWKEKSSCREQQNMKGCESSTTKRKEKDGRYLLKHLKPRQLTLEKTIISSTLSLHEEAEC